MDFILILLAYLIGAFPTGIILAKIYGIDITKQGSGNVGATNIARIISKKAGLFTLLIDIGKGLLAVFLSKHSSHHPDLFYLASIAAVSGHCFSIPGFLKGGKGVATGLGTIIAINPLLAPVTLITFGISFYLSKIVSLSSLIAAISVPLIVIFISDFKAVLALAIIAGIIIYKHKENIKRLLRGEEKKFGFKEKTSTV